MSGLFKGKEAEAVVLNNRPFKCQVCENDKFFRREAQLNTSLATFFGMDWANRSAICLICSKCKYVHWFLP